MYIEDIYCDYKQVHVYGVGCNQLWKHDVPTLISQYRNHRIFHFDPNIVILQLIFTPDDPGLNTSPCLHSGAERTPGVGRAEHGGLWSIGVVSEQIIFSISAKPVYDASKYRDANSMLQPFVLLSWAHPKTQGLAVPPKSCLLETHSVCGTRRYTYPETEDVLPNRRSRRSPFNNLGGSI